MVVTGPGAALMPACSCIDWIRRHAPLHDNGSPQADSNMLPTTAGTPPPKPSLTTKIMLWFRTPWVHCRPPLPSSLDSRVGLCDVWGKACTRH